MGVTESVALRWVRSNRERPRLDPSIKAVQAQVGDDGGCVMTVQGHGTVIIPADLCVAVGRFLIENWAAR